MNLKKCEKCFSYTLHEECKKCKIKTKDAHYKFLNFSKKHLKQKSI
ncbi:ribosome biogenesis protein [Candidatus Pacearchaeota archaeon CG10_big_fil_rev_8_21_14_0_10_32_42]|nr:MAG: ribosome biogenesis protein [Candidatus Pacearchaeota archaeon CG10_big_fil_rev_8_21_14_0_10_32_42]